MKVLVASALCLGCFLEGPICGMDQTKGFQGMQRQRISSEFWKQAANSFKKDISKVQNGISEKIKKIRNRNTSSQSNSPEGSIHLDIDMTNNFSDNEGEEFDIVPIPRIETLSESSDSDDEEEITDEILSENFSLGSEEENLNEILSETPEQNDEIENQNAELINPVPVITQDNQLTALRNEMQSLKQRLKNFERKESIKKSLYSYIENQKFRDKYALSHSDQYKGASPEQKKEMEIDSRNQWLHSDEQQRIRWRDIQSLRQQQSEIQSRIAEIQAQIDSLQNR